MDYNTPYKMQFDVLNDLLCEVYNYNKYITTSFFGEYGICSVWRDPAGYLLLDKASDYVREANILKDDIESLIDTLTAYYIKKGVSKINYAKRSRFSKWEYSTYPENIVYIDPDTINDYSLKITSFCTSMSEKYEKLQLLYAKIQFVSTSVEIRNIINLYNTIIQNAHGYIEKQVIMSEAITQCANIYKNFECNVDTLSDVRQVETINDGKEINVDNQQISNSEEISNSENNTNTSADGKTTSARKKVKNIVDKLQVMISDKEKPIRERYEKIGEEIKESTDDLQEEIQKKINEVNKSGLFEFDKKRYNLTTIDNEAVLFEVNKLIYEKYFKNVQSWDFSDTEKAKDFFEKFFPETIDEDFYVDGKKYHLHIQVNNTFGNGWASGDISDGNKTYTLIAAAIDPQKYIESIQSAEKWAIKMAVGAYKEMLNELIGWDFSFSSMATGLGATKFKNFAEKLDKILGDEVLGVLTDPNYQLGTNFEETLIKEIESLSDIRNLADRLFRSYDFIGRYFASLLNDETLLEQIFGTTSEGIIFTHDVLDMGSAWLGNINKILKDADVDTCDKIISALDRTMQKIESLGGLDGIADRIIEINDDSWFHSVGDIAEYLSLFT